MDWQQSIDYPNDENWWMQSAMTPENHVLSVYGYYDPLSEHGSEFQAVVIINDNRYALGHTPHDNPAQSKEWCESKYAEMLKNRIEFVTLKPESVLPNL